MAVTQKVTRQRGAAGIPLGSEEFGIDMPDTIARLELPRMATNKSGGGPWGWDVTP